MNETELRVRWEERVSTKDKGVLDAIWQDFENSGDVDYALNEPETGLEDLVLDTESRLKYWRLGRRYAKPVGRSARTVMEVELSDYEKECAETASLYLAKRAASLPEVRRFRQERLGGRVLTTEEAKGFLRDEILGDVPDDLGSLSEVDRLWIEHVRSMSVEELRAEYPDYVVSTNRPAVVSFPGHIFPYESSGAMILSRENIAENYSDLSLYLTAILPWDFESAAWFVLTGERPEIMPLELSYHRRRQVFTLSFAPWISEKTIRKAYRKGQEVVQGGDNRRMKERTLAVVRFVTEHTDDEGSRPSWPKLTDLWNKEHSGEWRFKDRFGLRKAYLRAEKELAGPWR